MEERPEDKAQYLDASFPPIYVEDLPYTAHRPSIKKAVHSNNPLIYKKIVSNPRLEEEDCRYLLPFMADSPMLRAILVEQASFPSDLLSELALSEEHPFVRHVIASHPNALPEDAVISVLRGTVDHAEYIQSWFH